MEQDASTLKTQRYRFASDDDGHNYLIKDEDAHRFEEWLATYNEEPEDDTEEYDGPDFGDYMINGTHTWSFTDPKED